jgi:4-hydroxy-tetrahydrodipicolinate synthase
MIQVPPLRPRRSIDGISAVLLPFHADGRPDRETWVALVERTWAAGLTPAVNMDTGYANLLTPTERAELARLRKENAILRMERELLKEYAAFCVMEMS